MNCHYSIVSAKKRIKTCHMLFSQQPENLVAISNFVVFNYVCNVTFVMCILSYIHHINVIVKSVFIISEASL